MKTQPLSQDLICVSSIDAQLRTFDVIMRTEYGTTYNAYVLRGSEKNALIETSKAGFTGEYIKAIGDILPIASVDYLIISHTEPDHSGAIERLLDLNPNITIVATATALGFLKEIVNRPFASQAVKTGDTLSLGNKTLHFYALPNLHWPDTMFTYIDEERALVTCDAFGAHYATEELLRSEIKRETDYQSALKYYFDNIIGPFRQPFMQKALDTIDGMDIRWILTGHGPVLDSGIDEVMAQYRAWCAAPEKARKHIVIAYVSAYGYTAQLAQAILGGICETSDIDVSLHDMVTASPDLVLAEMAQADGILLGSPTMLGDALEPIQALTIAMLPPVYGGKHASAFGSYGWSGEGVPNLLARCKQVRLKVLDEGLRVRFKPTDDDLQSAYDFGKAFAARVQ